MPQITTSRKTEEPLLPLAMISHGTLNCVDMQESRRFYEEVMGFEVLQFSPVSLLLRLGSDHTYVVVETGEPGHMEVLDHNGVDVPTREDVDLSRDTLLRVKDDYGIKKVNKIMEQHGVYSFYFQDLDNNWWEVMAAKARGYAWAYDNPVRDMSGRSDIDPDDMGHVMDDGYATEIGLIPRSVDES